MLLAQAAYSALLEKVLAEHGPMWLIIIVVSWLVVWYGPRLVNGHTNLMNTLATSQIKRDERDKEMVEVQTKQAALLESALIREPASCAASQAALGHIAQGLATDTKCEDARGHYERARSRLGHA